MNYKADYHMHSNYSDGKLTPTELAKKYKEEGYDIIALTDHDGVDGIREAQIAGEALDLEVIPGIELSTLASKELLEVSDISKDYLEIHLLGYHIDIENEALLEQIALLKKIRHDRNVKLIEILNNMNVDITLEEIKKDSKREYVGKPNIARLMVKKGYVETPNDAFEEGKYMGSDEVKSLTRDSITIEKGIETIKVAGGISVLAHPMKLKMGMSRGSEEFYIALDKVLKYLKKQGLKGLECYHSSHAKEEALRLVELAEKYHLHITEGSDFHGDDWRIM